MKVTDYLLSFWKTLFDLGNGCLKFLCCGILDFLTTVLETSYLACIGFEMVFTRPWFSAFEALSFGLCFANVHWTSSLSSKISQLIWVDFCPWCQSVTIGSGRDKRRLEATRDEDSFEGRLQRTRMLGASTATPCNEWLLRVSKARVLEEARTQK